ncbi:hypothetical protein EJ070_19675 [Mesorhizobium sp. M1E.F.Ca.ET.045.02.1.1]|uniref:hypothetical protein n=1 Tax=Mesorhizobium sp. M1E.F.Ca.ET.045.02.1.1 TaxID=2493672 RepID=UPI000F75A12C|nr:hypothetical protein [Mesorhizobium sp. M1E.F.Ca.ET.045.02.1.1]AZO22668.1 hypothetical protein EJ070_19675 [Mesorhizobium sp. M1E.F.Ca.ET.045.02.1.1]
MMQLMGIRLPTWSRGKAYPGRNGRACCNGGLFAVRGVTNPLLEAGIIVAAYHCSKSSPAIESSGALRGGDLPVDGRPAAFKAMVLNFGPQPVALVFPRAFRDSLEKDPCRPPELKD